MKNPLCLTGGGGEKKINVERRLPMRYEKSAPIILFAGILVAIVIGTSVLSQTQPRGAVNLVKEEMLVLDPAFKKIIDAVALGNMKIIKPALTELHEAREEIEKAVKAGQKITLQKNQAQLKEFIELDDKFHEEFDALEKAAEAGNKKVVKDQTHKLLDACVVCHERFKK
jgi:soluble cytochrome b562